MESPLLRELKGLLVSSPEESVRLQKESPLLRELEGFLGSLHPKKESPFLREPGGLQEGVSVPNGNRGAPKEEPFAPDEPKRSLLGVPAPKGARGAPSLLSRKPQLQRSMRSSKRRLHSRSRRAP